MASTSNSTSVAIWLAVIGGLASSSGYVIAYYKDIDLQEKKERHDLIVRLLREDPFQSSRNLLWANETKLISLEAGVISRLKSEPLNAPTASTVSSGQASIDQYIPPEKNVTGLVIGLDGPTLTIRTQSLRTLLDDHRQSNEAAKEALAGLSGDRLNLLSLNGRYNILYFLEKLDWSKVEDEVKQGAVAAVENILQRHKQGIALAGSKTMDQIKNIKLLVARQGN